MEASILFCSGYPHRGAVATVADLFRIVFQIDVRIFQKSFDLFIRFLQQESGESVEVIGDEDEEESNEPANKVSVYDVPELVKHEPEDVDDCLIVPTSTQAQTSIRHLNPYSTLQVKNHEINKRKRSNPNSNVTHTQQNTAAFQLPFAVKDAQSSKHSASPVQALQITSYSIANEEPQSSPVSSTNIEIPNDNRASSGEDDEIFAKYITSELRQIKDPHVKRIVKHKIQNIIFEAHCSLRK